MIALCMHNQCEDTAQCSVPERNQTSLYTSIHIGYDCLCVMLLDRENQQ